MSIIITGASGFVGSNFKNFLDSKGCDFTILDLKKHTWREDVDRQATAIVHLAGKAHDTANTSSPLSYFKINSELTKELYQEFLQSDIRDFIYFSSVKAVADTVNGKLKEDTPARPLTPYGKSKLEAEEYLRSVELPASKRLFIIRPCMIHGPGNKGNLNLLYKIVKLGLPWPLASFHNTRSVLGIDNLCYIIHALITRPKIASGVYNVADDEIVSTNEIIDIMSETLGKKPRLLYLSPKLVTGIAKVGDVIPFLPINSERLQKLTESYVVSNEKIKKVLAIDKLPVESDNGLRKTFRSFLNT